MRQNDQQGLVILIIVVLIIVALARRRWRPSTTAFGTASWASEKLLSDQYLIAFLRGMPPILARRIKWYKDPAFRPAAAIRAATVVFLALLAAAIALVVWAASQRQM